MVILDTNIIIEHLRLKGSKDSILIEVAKKYPLNDLAISIATVQELYSGKSSKNALESQRLALTLSGFQILDYDYNIAKKAGEIARDLHRKIYFVDAILASTAILNGAKLVTLNVKDFDDIDGLVIEII